MGDMNQRLKLVGKLAVPVVAVALVFMIANALVTPMNAFQRKNVEAESGGIALKAKDVVAAANIPDTGHFKMIRVFYADGSSSDVRAVQPTGEAFPEE